jgi:peptidoglycan/LPS O-acetylase OafA/YrhL
MLSFVFYTGNLVVPWIDLGKHSPTLIWIMRRGYPWYVGDIGSLWSLCVEEQFYLLWPAVIFLVRGRKKLMYICVVVAVLTMAGRIVLCRHAGPSPSWSSWVLIYWSTYTRCDTLLIGAWLALYLRGRQMSIAQLRWTAAGLFWIPVVCLVVGLRFWPNVGMLTNPFTLSVGYTLIALAAMGLLMRTLDERGWIARIFEFKPLAGLGVISYGFYFYHSIPWPIWSRIWEQHPRLLNVIPFVAFALTLALAWTSYRFLETPFLRLKKVLAPQRSDERLEDTALPPGFHVSEPHA